MSFKDVLRIKAFRHLWLGQAISQLGDSIYYVAFMFMAQQVTGSFAMVGYVGAMETLPYLLVGPYMGVVADRIDRKKIMLLSDLASATTLVGFAIFVEAMHGKPPVWALLLIPFALSVMRSSFMPAKGAAIPRLVPPELLVKANALSSATFNIVGLAGLGLSAGIIAKLYELSPLNFFAILLLLNALSFAGSAMYIAKLPSIEPDREHAEDKHPLEDFKAGLRYMRRRHDLKMFVVLLAAFRLGIAPFFVAYVAANKLWFGGKPQTLLWFEFAFFAGMMTGAFLGGKMKVRRPTMAFSWELFLIGLFVCGMILPSVAVFVGLNTLCGIVVGAGDIPMVTYLQVSVEDAYRGRVNSVKEMITTGVMPVGMALGGFLLGRMGLVGSFVAMGAVCMVAGAAGFVDKKYRNVLMPEEALASTNAMQDAGSKKQDAACANPDHVIA